MSPLEIEEDERDVLDVDADKILSDFFNLDNTDLKIEGDYIIDGEKQIHIIDWILNDNIKEEDKKKETTNKEPNKTS